MTRRSDAGLLTALALCLAPAYASAASSDLAATHGYIQANYALARTSVARVGEAQAKITQLNSTLGGQMFRCRRGLPAERSLPTNQRPGRRCRVVPGIRAYADAIHTFTSKVSRLRWSNNSITRRAKSYAASLSEMASIPMPDLCAVVSAWRDTGFQTVTAATVSLVARVEAIELNPVPALLLAPYVRGAEASVIRRTSALETRLEEAEFKHGQHDTFQLLETLGLQQ